MTKNLNQAPAWRTFSRDYDGFGEAFTQRPARCPSSRRTSSRQQSQGRSYLLQISPLESDVCLNVSARRVSYRVGVRLVDWLRSRGHTAFLY